jgi:hypothetical protein
MPLLLQQDMIVCTELLLRINQEIRYTPRKILPCRWCGSPFARNVPNVRDKEEPNGCGRERIPILNSAKNTFGAPGGGQAKEPSQLFTAVV